MTLTPAGSAAPAISDDSVPPVPQRGPWASDSVRASVARVLEQLQERLDARRSVFFAADSSQRILTVAATHGASAAQYRASFGRGVAGRVAESGRPIVVPAVAHEPMALLDVTEPSKWQRPSYSLVSVPVFVETRCVGVLSVYFVCEPGTDFTAHLRRVQVLGSRIADSLKSSERMIRSAERTAAKAEFPYEYSNLIGSTLVMRQLYEQVSQVARTTATVLIRGESGTGKELVAQAIHNNSARAQQPFVKVNCAAIPETLFESELFGHERGAFTGAHSRKIGRFEMAQGGTVFLDELGELPVATQVKLLRVLQSREFERLGGTGTLRTDIRLIAATNKDLERGVADGSFREDLYYRLNVFTIVVPPLRQRAQDIPVLARFFLEKYATEHGRRASRIDGQALDALCRYEWPGNVRELENAIERAVVVCDGLVLDQYHLPESILAADTPRPSTAPTLAEAVEELERRMIEHALREARGNLAKASRALGATERIIRYKVGKYGIEPSRFRA